LVNSARDASIWLASPPPVQVARQEPQQNEAPARTRVRIARYLASPSRPKCSSERDKHAAEEQQAKKTCSATQPAPHRRIHWHNAGTMTRQLASGSHITT